MGTTLECQHEWIDATPDPVATFQVPTKTWKCKNCGAKKVNNFGNSATSNISEIIYHPPVNMGGTSGTN